MRVYDALLFAVCTAVCSADLIPLTKVNGTLVVRPATLTMVLVVDETSRTSQSEKLRSAFVEASALTRERFDAGEASWTEEVSGGRPFATYAQTRPLFAETAVGAEGLFGGLPGADFGPGVVVLVPKHVPGTYWGRETAEDLADFAHVVWGDGFARPLRSKADVDALMDRSNVTGSIAVFGDVDDEHIGDYLATARYTAQQQATLAGPPMVWGVCFRATHEGASIVTFGSLLSTDHMHVSRETRIHSLQERPREERRSNP